MSCSIAIARSYCPFCASAFACLKIDCVAAGLADGFENFVQANQPIPPRRMIAAITIGMMGSPRFTGAGAALAVVFFAAGERIAEPFAAGAAGATTGASYVLSEPRSSAKTSEAGVAEAVGSNAGRAGDVLFRRPT